MVFLLLYCYAIQYVQGTDCDYDYDIASTKSVDTVGLKHEQESDSDADADADAKAGKSPSPAMKRFRKTASDEQSDQSMAGCSADGIKSEPM